MTDNDEYKRTNGAAPVGELLGSIVDREPPLLGYTPEWWEQRERVVAEARAKDTALAEQSRMASRAGELRDNGFPEMAIAAVLSGELADTTALHVARGFVEAYNLGLKKRVLVLGGGVGVGKTTAATFVAMKGQDPRPGFIRISELERRGRYDKNLDAWLKDKTSLVIDDVGAEVLDGKGVFRSLLDEIIDMFYANRRTLVMTTNLRPRQKPLDQRTSSEDHVEQFLERYGERVWSRLSQLGEWGNCGTRDLRREKP